MPEKKKTVRLTAREQASFPGLLYEMSMRFKCDAGITQINDILDQMGMDDKPMVRDAMTIRVTQTVPFVPDEDAIRKYEQTLDGTRTGTATLSNVRFDGYDYLYAVRDAG